MLDASVRMAYRVAHSLLRAYWFVRRPTTHGALVAVWFDGKILLVKSSYRKTVSLPGGYVHRNEDPRDAAARELREELGITVPSGALEHVYGGTHLFENRDDKVDIFELRVTEPPAVQVDNREVVWAGLCTAREALGMNLVPHLVDYLKDR